MLPASSPDSEQLALLVPGNGSVEALRQLLNELSDAGVEVAGLSIHAPDLDDVFFAVTGHASEAAQQEVLQS
jgi:ABC-2 type transport system ATP-binding protein